MTKDIVKKSQTNDLFDSFKKKLIDLGIDYVKTNFKFKKEDIAQYVEKHIQKNLEIKVKKEVRKQTYKFSSYVLLGLGFSFITYFILDLIVILLQLPAILTNLLFGLFLALFGALLYILR